MIYFVCHRCGLGVDAPPPDNYNICLRCWNEFYYLPNGDVQRNFEPANVLKWVTEEHEDVLRYVIARQIRRIVT